MQVNVTETLTDVDTFDYEYYGTYYVTTTFTNFISSEYFNFTIDVDQVFYYLSVVTGDSSY